jgi:uncharacterized protein YdaT
MEMMSGDEMREHLKGKSQEEIADFIREKLLEICNEAERLSVEDEDYEKANNIIKIEERIKKNKKK